MTTPNYHPTLLKVAPRSDKPTEPSSTKPASANLEMKEKGTSDKPTKDTGTSEKPTKQKMKENANGAGRNRENPPGTQVASLLRYEKFIKELNPRQLTYIQLIGLGELLKTPDMRMRRLLCHVIAYSYDAERDAFIINGRPCRITLKDVEHITGMPCMGKNHVSSNQNDTLELWKELKNPNDTKVILKGLLAKMKGHSTPNFVRPFVLYTIGKYVCPTTQQKFANGGANLEGNLPLQQTWYYEKWRVHQLDSTISYASRRRDDLITEFNDEEDKVVVVACKESLKNVSQLCKELDASQGAPSLDLRKHSKATTSLEAFLRQDSVVDSMLPTRASNRKRVVSSLLGNEYYVLYDSDKKRKKNRTQSESTNNSKDTNNTKRKNRASNFKDTNTSASRLETDLDKFRQIYVAEIVNTSDLDKQLVVIDDIVLLHKHLQCVTVTDGGEDDKWLGDEIMCHDHPKDIRDRQLVYIERVASGLKKMDASLPPYEEFINGLNTQQRMYVQFIGLGGVFKTPSIKIRRVLCLTIANSYDAEQDAFIINRRACRITLEDVAHITGMPCDGKKHVPSNVDDNMELWKKLKDRNDTKITFKGLLAKMKGDSTPNFGRPFVLYTIGKYVCRSKEEYVDNKYIGTVRNVETIKGTNLGQLKLDYLMDGVKNFVNGEAILEGNLPLLQYVEDLMRPFIPARDGTLAKQKTAAQIKVLVGRVLTVLQEVATLVREAGAEQVDRVVDVAIHLMHHDEPIDTRDGQVVYIERVADVAKLERDGFSTYKHLNVHWFLVVVNPGRKEIQAYIDKFRGELRVVLVDSPYNKMKYRKRFKQYHATLSDGAAVEDDEDASS
ncbi:hypothetical protein D1007_49468 [Hordeum vulgare]|nr:hypothetical protein D1007_49468 [Hordeum vulgare]